jgi:two-component system response regulator MprA
MSRDLRVLVVEDDEALRKLLCAFLERHGCIVAAAGDGVEGLEAVRTALPDVVVADVMLPRRDGLWLWREAVTLQPSLLGRFLFISGTPFPEKDGGAEEERFLQKPFSITHFWSEVLATAQDRPA